MKPSPPSGNRNAAAFSLVELLVSLGIILLILLVLVSMVDTTRRTWNYTSAKSEQFREARDAFEVITRRLGQATLNPYWDYVDSNGSVRGANNSFIPDHYARLSELRFISGPGLAGDLASTPPRPTHSVFFQAPLALTSGTSYANLETMLNTVGYFVEFNTDQELRPACINAVQPGNYRLRFRLKEMIEPSESFSIYQYTSGNATYTGKDWFTALLNATGGANAPWSRVLAENVVALVLLPKLSAQDVSTGVQLTGSYSYSSTDTNANAAINPKNQLPPIVQITMVAIDEDSARRLASRYGSSMPSLGLGDLFLKADQYSSDLQTLEATLTGLRLSYRIFTTEVPIKAAKWSQEQTK